MSEEQLGSLFNVLDDLKEDELFERSIDKVFRGQFENLSESFKQVVFLIILLIKFQAGRKSIQNDKSTNDVRRSYGSVRCDN